MNVYFISKVNFIVLLTNYIKLYSQQATFRALLEKGFTMYTYHGYLRIKDPVSKKR